MRMLRPCKSFWCVYMRSASIDTHWVFLSLKFFCCINQTCIETRAKLFSFLFSLVPFRPMKRSRSSSYFQIIYSFTLLSRIKEKALFFTGPTHGIANGPTVRPHGRIKIWEAGLLCRQILADFVNKGPKGGWTCILFNDKPSKSHKCSAFSRL